MASSSLPAAVAERIESFAASADIRGLSCDVKQLSHVYRTGSGSAKGDRDALAYAVYRMPATFAAAERALSLSLACMDLRPGSLLDAGAGTGAMTMAVSSLLSLDSCICLEREPAMRALGKELTQAAGIRAEWRAFDLMENAALPGAALVTEGYMLCELPEDHRVPTVLKLWEAAQEMLLLIEPGTPEGFGTILRAREALLSAGAHIASPCPGECACPLQKGDWCHFSARLPRTKRMLQVKGGDVPYEDEKFAFLACTRLEPVRCSARILRHPRIAPGRIGVTLCTGDRTEERVITKKNPLWKQIRKTEWGDRL